MNQETFTLTLDGAAVTAYPGDTLWQVAKRAGETIPHLCFKDAEGYRADGNCRACMVEVQGERALVASCLREAKPGMVVHSATSERSRVAREGVLEMLAVDQPPREQSPDASSHFWAMADQLAIDVGEVSERLPKRSERTTPTVHHVAERESAVVKDRSHSAMAVNLDACIECNLCVRACREVQVNDVIGLAHRGSASKIVFDFDDPMGDSTCVACGECVQACPTGALMPATLVDEHGVGDSVATDKQVDSVCPYCGVGCQLTYHLKNDEIVYVEGRNGPSNHNRLCVKGRFGFDYPRHPSRLTTPLIRREGVAKGLDPDFDPAQPLTHFREASWEEALEFAATGLITLKAEQGPQALAGFGSAKCSNEEAWLFQKLIRTGFGTNNVDHCTRLCHASSVAALMECLGSGAVTASFMQAANADVVILTGCNPAVNHPVAATFFKQVAKRGTQFIIIDPRGQALDAYAHLSVRFKPGADVALFNALLNVIVTEGLYDETYIAEHTEGFDALKAHVVDMTPEAMSAQCGVEAETIREVARLYANAERAMIFWGMGISQHTHGTDNARCLISLALACGHTGRPGTGLHPLRGQNNVQGASDVGLIPMFYPDYKSVADDDARARFEDLWDAKLDPNPGLTVVEITDAIHEGAIRGMYIMGENPAMSDPNVAHARAALAKLDHLVVQDLFLTETAAFADVVLPASAFAEKDGTFTNTDRRMQMGRQALDPPGEARQDLKIIQEIARRLGLDWHYDHPREVFAEMRECMPSIKGITWERLERESAVTYPCDDESEPGREVIFGDGFPTASGRGKFVPCNIVPPDETPDQDYPLVLTTGRLLEHWHTGAMTRRTDALNAIEPEAMAFLSPGDLGKAGAAPGDTVEVETRRGSIQLMARRDSRVPEGVVFIPFCFVEAAANLLTNDALDPFGKIPEVKYCAARVRLVAPVAAE